jgi:hypothetical protein
VYRRKEPPRLSIQEIVDLRRSAEHLVATDAMLQATNWGGAPGVRVLLKGVYEVVAALYNKGEPALLAYKAHFEAPEAAGASALASAADHPGKQPGARQAED